MPTTPGPRYKGWWWDKVGDQLTAYFNGVVMLQTDGSPLESTAAISAGTTLTSAQDLTVTTGNSVNSAGDERITAGNLRLGVVSAFANTEPTSAAVMKEGTAPAGAITTSGAVFSSATVVRKIIADGTVSNVGT